MPSRASASATAPIRLSVFRNASRASTPSSFRSGTMSEKICRCCTWPAITASRAPAALQDVDRGPELAERDPVELVDLALELRRGLLAQRQRHHAPAGTARARGGEEREAAVAGDEPEDLASQAALLLALVVRRAARAARARRRASSRARTRRACARRRSAVRCASTRASASASVSPDACSCRKACLSAAIRSGEKPRRRSPTRFEPEEAGPVPDRQRERQHVLGGDRGPAHERVRAHAAELVHAREAADGRVVLHLDVSRERRARSRRSCGCPRGSRAPRAPGP